MKEATPRDARTSSSILTTILVVDADPGATSEVASALSSACRVSAAYGSSGEVR